MITYSCLYQVYLPALQGHLPADVLQTFRALLEFYYIACRDVITTDDLDDLEDAISRFHSFREVFAPIRAKGFSLPRQHAIVHYPALIRLFGAPNGLCSSITESKHIRAVKEPWRRSNRNAALFQMLKTNQRLDQLSAARVNFTKLGMLDGTLLSSILPNSGVYHIDYNCLQFLQLSLGNAEKEHGSSENGSKMVSIADENEGQAIVTDDDVLAMVKLAQKSRELPSSNKILLTNCHIRV